MSVHMQGSGIALVDMAAATINMNDDGSFHLLTGSTDLGTGSDTVLAQIAAEVLGVGLDAMTVTAADTDLTPFDTGAYASSTTYVSGRAVELAARKVREQILAVAAGLLETARRSPSFMARSKDLTGRYLQRSDAALLRPRPRPDRRHRILRAEASPPPFMASSSKSR
jgi:CO/xanthine dehydrogenase Mo-binding subunit